MSLPIGITESAERLAEGWGDLVPFTEYPQFEQWDGGGRYYGLYTSIEDRDNGKCRPLYETETDLQRQRAQVRALDVYTAVPSTALEALARYTFGTGWTPSIAARKGLDVSPQVVAYLQALIDNVCEQNNLINGLDLELHARWRQDGEFLATWRPTRDSLQLDVYEPDQLTQPRGASDLDEWLYHTHGIDCSAFEPSWSFGVLTPRRRAEQHLAYFVALDSGATDWDVLPESRTVFARRNVPRIAKRGVSDFLPVLDAIRNAAKLGRNVALGAALQASIAWIEEFAAGTPQDKAQASGMPSLETTRRPAPAGTTGTSSPIYAKRYEPGTILRTPAGKQYKPGPMGSERNAGFGEAAQMALRSIGARWLMPEAMISGDASNANYASALVAEAPFIKARQSDQQQFGRLLTEALWKAIGTSWQLGRLDRLGLRPDELRRLCEITIDWPEVNTRNVTEQVQKLQFGLDRGLVAPATAAAELGYDHAQEIAAGATVAPTPAAFPSQFAAAMESMQAPNAADALNRLWEGYP